MATGCLMAAAVCAALAPGALNDLDKTPGDIRTTNKNIICSVRTGTVRNVTAAVKRKVFESYGLTNKTGWCAPGGCEVDHLISLELGGSNDIANLWPQPYVGEWNARQKDKLENRLHKLICDGTLSPQEAQVIISQDWISGYLKYIKP